MRRSPIALAVLLAIGNGLRAGGQTTRAALDAPARTAAATPTGPEPVTPAAVPIVRTTVEVNAHADGVETVRTGPRPFHASAGEIMGSAGTFGDFSRYLQLFPGVVFNTDTSDDLLVRGGNPIENLFLVDGFEIPNINHIASEGTTGGLVSMIDTSAIQNLELYTGGYDASYDERLSSVIDIHTREPSDRERHANAEFGFVGTGGLLTIPLPGGGSLLGSAHRSLLNLFTDDIGLNGVPIYSNVLVSVRLAASQKDEITALSLSGFDSIRITPCSSDVAETSTIDTQYAGWRTTNGIRWRHVYSRRLFGAFSAADSEQQEDVNQEDQFYEIVSISPTTGPGLPLTPVYSERSHDGRSIVKYDLGFDSGKLSLIAGSSGVLNHINYRIAQPNGEPSPLSADPAASDAARFSPDFLSGESGSYAQATLRVGDRWTISTGGRLQTFALGGHWTATPRLHTAVRLSQRTGLHFAYGEYAQMPPAVFVTSWPQNRFLLPIRVRHLIAGSDLYSTARGRIGIEAYRKNYRDYPVSSEYPTLSLANTVDTLGALFLWMPMTSRGSGLAEGIELFGNIRAGSHLAAQANIAYARAKFAALDGILRPGNFDYPLVLNSSGSWHSARHYELSWRYEYTTGRPYTPFQMSESLRQNRPIYDLSQVNALRGPYYSRLDFEISRAFFLGTHRLIAYGGLENALNRQNFLGYFWMPREDAYWSCGRNPQNCLSAQHEMVRFPDFGVRYFF